MTGHHYRKLTVKKVLLRSEAPPFPPFSCSFKKRRRFKFDWKKKKKKKMVVIFLVGVMQVCVVIVTSSVSVFFLWFFLGLFLNRKSWSEFSVVCEMWMFVEEWDLRVSGLDWTWRFYWWRLVRVVMSREKRVRMVWFGGYFCVTERVFWRCGCVYRSHMNLNRWGTW
jgi:hypothetical protein